MAGPADPVLVRRILEETGVDQTAAAPSWSAYAEAVTEAFFAWLRARVPGLHGMASLARDAAPLVALVAVFAAAGILYVLARSVLRRRRHPVPLPTPTPAGAASPAVRAAQRDRSAWRAEMEAGLAAGDVTAALEALWWWFAYSLCAAAVDPSWTSEELLTRCGRVDLAAPARALDRLLYGSARPTVDEVRQFLGRLEALLR
jgi:hypothetical protein